MRPAVAFNGVMLANSAVVTLPAPTLVPAMCPDDRQPDRSGTDVEMVHRAVARDPAAFELLVEHGSTDGDFAGVVGISQDNHSPSSSDAAIASALTASARAAGLRSVAVSFEDAAGFGVPVVSGETGDPASFVRIRRGSRPANSLGGLEAGTG
jgi:hypothetical protein